MLYKSHEVVDQVITATGIYDCNDIVLPLNGSKHLF